MLARAKVKDNAMAPLLEIGDEILYRKVKPHELNLNDFIYKPTSRDCIQRVIYISSAYMVTKGDNGRQAEILDLASLSGVYKVIKLVKQGQKMPAAFIYLTQSGTYFEQILRITQRFHQKKLRFLFLKGLPLHLYYEKTPPQKLYSDCDILVQAEDRATVSAILREEGYREISLLPFGDLQQAKPEHTFIKVVNQVAILFDVHYELVFMMAQLGWLNGLYPRALYKLITAEFMRAARRVGVNGYAFPILETPYLIIYLMLHFYHHNLRGPQRLQLVLSIMKHEAIAVDAHVWNEMAQIVRRYKLEPFVYPGFKVLEQLFDVPIPAVFMAKLQPSLLVQLYIAYLMRTKLVFQEQSRLLAGLTRFLLLLLCSPCSVDEKWLFFLRKEWWATLLLFVKNKVK